MKIISLFLFLAIINLLPAQTIKLSSLQYSISNKDYKGDFIEPKEWVSKSIQIEINLNRNVIEISSKEMVDRNQFIIEEKISTPYKKNDYTTSGDDKILLLNGIDSSGEKCIVRLILKKDEFKITDGVFRIEYIDRIKIYKIKQVKS